MYSTTLERADWNSTIVREVVSEVRSLQAQPGGDLALGGADLAATFLRHDLVDEFRLYVHPVSETSIPLRLAAGARTFGNGVVLLRYESPTAV